MGNVWDAALDAAKMDDVSEVVEEPEVDEPLSVEQIGLMYIGSLTDSFELFGHKISIRTLKIGEELEAELLTQKFKDTQEADRAYTIALVAACITSLDGRPLTQGLGPADETLERRYNYILQNWHWITVSAIYNKYRDLAARAIEAQDDLKKN